MNRTIVFSVLCTIAILLVMADILLMGATYPLVLIATLIVFGSIFGAIMMASVVWTIVHEAVMEKYGSNPDQYSR